MGPLAALLASLALLSLPLRAVALSFQSTANCLAEESGFRHDGELLCHRLTQPLPFAGALAQCRAFNGRLVTVLDKAHNDFLLGLLDRSAFIGAVERQRMLRHPLFSQPAVVWAWLSGRPATFVNVLDHETRGFYRQPDGGGFEGCMVLLKHPVLNDVGGDGRWGDADCRAPKPALCVRRPALGPPSLPKKLVGGRGVPAVSRSTRGVCAAGFARLGVWRLGERLRERRGRSSCLSWLQPAANYTAALLQCQALDLAATVWRPARAAHPRRWLELEPLADEARVWAGADRRNRRLQWRWQAGGRVPAAAWAAGEPLDELARDCAAYDAPRRGLVAVKCGARLPHLCETTPRTCLADHHLDDGGDTCFRDSLTHCRRGKDTLVGAAGSRPFCKTALCRAVCPEGTTQHGDTCFAVKDEPATKDEAIRYCFHAKGMQSAEVFGPADNAFVKRQVVRIGRPAWVDGGGSFTNYHRYVPYGLPDEPNEGRHSCTIAWFDGEWMDVDCQEKFATVCTMKLLRADCADAQKA